MSPVLLFTTLSFACGDKDQDTAAADGGGADGGSSDWDGNTGPYLSDTGQEPAPEVDTLALGQAITDAVGQAIQVQAVPVIEAYIDLAEDMDADCPSWYNADGIDYWYDSCTSSAGTSFDGYVYALPYDGYVDEDGTVYDGVQLYGLARIVTQEGRSFEAGGGAAALSGLTVAGARVSYSYLESGFQDSAAEGTWLDGSMDPALTVWASWDPASTGNYILVDGVLNGLDGAIEALVLDEVSMGNEAAWGCELEPTATVSALDREGNWVDVVFEAADKDDPLCDGCGAGFVGGLSIGEVCADFSALVDWQGSPWW